MLSDTVSELRVAFPDISLKQAVSARRLSTFHIGGEIECLLEVNSPEELANLLSWIAKSGLGLSVLGAGSNLLISDDGISVPVLKLGRGFNYIRKIESDVYEVGAACALMSLARKVSLEGYAGMEFAGGIPASLGGAVFMNAGAHGGEMAEIVEAVQVALPNSEIQWLQASALSFTYRRTHLPKGAVVLAARLRLCPSDKERVQAKLNENLSARKATQPLAQPSAGSVFKNPDARYSAGWYLEQAGLKGQTVGTAIVSDLHANWIVNPQKTASADEVKTLIFQCQESVRNKFKIELETEIIYWK